jgi:hypothetical protein
MVKLPVLWLFDASFAVQETVVVPTGNIESELGLQRIDGLGSTASLATAL